MAEPANSGQTLNVTRRTAVRRGALAAGIVAGLAQVATPVAAAQDSTPGATPSDASIPADFRVVLHAAEVENWEFVLSNLRNLTTEWPLARLRVVVDGSAVTALQGENDLTTELGTMAAKGVMVQICPNALREHNIDVATVPSYAQTSLGGVVALVLAQHEGYAYVKP
jgi:intracellular sulfur oxidation DsrE/DsrF family protein